MSATKANRNNGGFTLVEALVTLIIVGLVTTAMATGIAFAFKQYDESMNISQAKVLQSTLKNALQNELSITSLIVLDGTEADDPRDVVAFFSPNYAVKEGYSEFKIVDSKTDSAGKPYGEIALGTGTDKTKWKKLISSSSYHETLGAQVHVVYHKAVVNAVSGKEEKPAYFTVYMRILSAPDREILVDEFDVEPLNAVTIKDASSLGS